VGANFETKLKEQQDLMVEQQEFIANL